jgi:hypothetical protein
MILGRVKALLLAYQEKSIQQTPIQDFLLVSKLLRKVI